MKNILFILIISLFLIISYILLHIYKNKHPLLLVHAVLYSYMKDLDAICEKHNLTYWADGGTLLGIVRDKGIIAHDDDIDIVMTEEDIYRLKDVIKDDPNYYIYLLEDFYIYKFAHKDIPGIFIDIFPIQKEINKANNEFILRYKGKKSRDRWPMHYYLESEIYPLKKVKFGDIFIWCPNKPHPYLDRGYGNWKVPVVYERH